MKASKNYSFNACIAEVERELAMRRDVYPRQRKREGALLIDIMLSVQDKLEWMRDHEDEIRAYIGERNKAA